MAVDYGSYYTDTLARVGQGHDYVTKLFDQSAKLQAGRQYAAGDTQGAAATVAGRGEIAQAAAIQKHGVEQFQAQHEFIQRAVPVFEAALARGGPQGVTHAFQTLIPTLKGMGTSDDQIAQWGQRFQTDPQGTIQALAAFAKLDLSFQKGGDGRIYALNKANGQQVGQPIGEATPQKPIVLPENGTLVGLNPDGSRSQIPVGQSQPTGGAQPSVAPAGGGAAAAQMPVAPVPVPVPQTAAAPVAIPAVPSPAAAGAVQPSRPPVAMAPDAMPPRPGLPPPDAVALGLPNPEGALPNSPSRATSQFAANTVQPEGQTVAPGYTVLARGAQRPQPRNPTDAERAKWGPNVRAIDRDGKPMYLEGAATAMDLRKEYTSLPDVKAFNDTAATYDVITRLARGKPSPATDISMVFAYMRLLDPTSVVREGEFATAQNAAGVPERIRNYFNKAQSGQILSPAQREDFLSAARELYTSRKERYDQVSSQFERIAREAGIKPEDVVQRRIPAGASRPAAARPPSQLDNLGIREGQRVIQNGKTYMRRGNQMVEVP